MHAHRKYYTSLDPEIALLVAMIEQAHKDARSQNQELRTDAQAFLRWCRVWVAGEKEDEAAKGVRELCRQ